MSAKVVLSQNITNAADCPFAQLSLALGEDDRMHDCMFTRNYEQCHAEKYVPYEGYVMNFDDCPYCTHI